MNTTRNLTITGIGIALFVVLSMALRVPVFDNYYLCLGYIAMAVYLYSFRVWQGTVVGTVGVILYCVLISGLRGMPGWVIGNLVIGIILGICFKITQAVSNCGKKIAATILEVFSIIMTTAFGILFVKSVVEVVLYAQPLFVRMGKNMSAFIADVIVLILALPICKILDPLIHKRLNLS